MIGSTLFPLWFFQGKEKMSHIAVVNVICNTSYAICIFMFIKGPQDFLLAPLFNSLFLIISGIWGLSIAFKNFRLRFILQKYIHLKDEIKTGWDIFISIVSINAYTTTRTFAVGLLTNNVLTGYYALAERIASVIQAFPMESFTQAVYPRISKVFAKNKQRALAIMYRIQDNITLGFIVCLPIIYFLLPWVITFLCGQNYPEILITIRILLVAILFVGGNNFRVQFLLVCGKQDLYAKIHITAAIIGLPLVFLLISKFSYLGAAISTVIIESGVFILTSIIINNLAKKITIK